MKKSLAIILLILISYISFIQQIYSQKENNIWSLNLRKQLDFNVSPPALVETTNFIFTRGQTASVCDNQGDLLFYTNGTEVINRRHEPMPNGRLYRNTNYAYSPALIVPMSEDSEKYYLFTLYLDVENFSTYSSAILSYSIIDMTLNNGLGDVVIQEQGAVISLHNNLADRLIAAKGECGSIWVITHEINNNRYLAFETNVNGISSPIISEEGRLLTDNVEVASQGFFDFSSDYTKLINTGGSDGFAEILEFNSKTGQFSNPIPLFTEDDTRIVSSACFSPDNSKLYLIEINGIQQLDGSIFQYDLLDFPNSNPTKNLIRSLRFRTFPNIQVGPNGIIYMNIREGAIGALTNPNDDINNITFMDSIYSADSETATFSAFQNPVVSPSKPVIKDSFLLLRDTQLCLNTQLNLQIQAEGDSYLWQDGTTSPTYNISESGTYWVNVQKGNCTFTDTLIVLPDKSIVELGADTTLCQGEQLTLNITNPQDLDILWQDGSKEENFLVHQSGTYWVESRDNSCSFRDSVNVFYFEQLLNLPNDTTICSNKNSLVLDTNLPNNEVRWQDGTINNSFTITESGLYWAETINGVCQERDSIIVDLQKEDSFLPNDTTLCNASSFLISSSLQSDSILWAISGALSKEYLVDSSGAYIAFIHKNNCIWADTIIVDFIENNPSDLPNDTTLCLGDTLTLDYSDMEGLVHWQDGSTEPLYKISQNGNYWVELNQNDCLSRDSIIVFFESLDLDLGADTIICEDNSLNINLNIPNATYFWQDGMTLANRNLLEEGLYIVQAETATCIAEDSIFVSIETCETETPCQVYIPNAFSPNRDGVNDYLEVYSNCELLDFNFQVFDRWGNRLFSSNDQLEYWNGSYKNQVLNNGVYLVFLNYRFPNDSQLQRKVETVSIFK